MQLKRTCPRFPLIGRSIYMIDNKRVSRKVYWDAFNTSTHPVNGSRLDYSDDGCRLVFTHEVLPIIR